MGKDKRPMDDAVLRAIGAELKAAIAEAGWEHVPLSVAAGLGLRTIGWYVAGRDIPLSKLLRIADAMNVDPGVLLTRLAAAARAAALAAHIAELRGAARTVTQPQQIITESADSGKNPDRRIVSQRRDVTPKVRGRGIR